MADPIDVAARRLISRYQAQRPLRAGSLLMTIFGDSIAPRGAAVTLASLIRLGGVFGLNERLVRTAMARLALDGWLRSRREGRVSEYRLSKAGRERFDAATRHIYGPSEAPWGGAWTLVVLPDTDRRARESARRFLGWAGFGEPLPGFFAHPTLPVAEAEALLRRNAGPRTAFVLSTGSCPPDSHAALVARGWDRAALAARYQRFLRQFATAGGAIDQRNDARPEAAFVIRTLLIHEYRRIHLRDPVLPTALLPKHWVGHEAYELCRHVYARVSPAAEHYLDQQAATLHGPLPPHDETWGRRFGGLTDAGTARRR